MVIIYWNFKITQQFQFYPNIKKKWKIEFDDGFALTKPFDKAIITQFFSHLSVYL